MSFGSIRNTSLASPSISAAMKKARWVLLTGCITTATTINPAMTAGLAAYSRRLSARATAAQSATANRPVTAKRAHATGFNAGEARP